jgi:hypothetical protein
LKEAKNEKLKYVTKTIQMLIYPEKRQRKRQIHNKSFYIKFLNLVGVCYLADKIWLFHKRSEVKSCLYQGKVGFMEGKDLLPFMYPIGSKDF